MLFSRKTISPKTLMLFTRQLATLLRAGVPLQRSLLILEQQESHPLLKKTIFQISEELHCGASLSHALTKHPLVFNNTYQSMVKAGEFGAVLGNVLDHLADLQERAEKIKSKTTSILIYPIIVLFMTSLILGLLLTVIVPKFEAVFSEILHGKPLPWMTHFVLEMSRMIIDHYLILVTTLIAFMSGLLYSFSTKLGTYWKDRFVLAMPLIGPFAQKINLSRWARVLGTLLNQDVPISQALIIAQETVNNRIFYQAIESIHHHILLGSSMTNALQRQNRFPLMVISMIDVGEETAQLPGMLLNIAAIYDEEVQTSIERFLSLLEPAMILLLALLVGSIVIALFLPLVSMLGEVGN